MTTMTATALYHMSDARGRDLGRVEIDGVERGWMQGTFTPGPDYPVVEPTFRALADMVEHLSFHFIDEATEAIAKLGITLRADPSAPAIPFAEVQIDSDNGFACRLPAERNGAHP